MKSPEKSGITLNRINYLTPEPQEQLLAFFQTVFHTAAKNVFSPKSQVCGSSPKSPPLAPGSHPPGLTPTLWDGRQAFCDLAANVILKSFTLVMLNYSEFSENGIACMPLSFYSCSPSFWKALGTIARSITSSMKPFLTCSSALLSPFQGEWTLRAPSHRHTCSAASVTHCCTSCATILWAIFPELIISFCSAQLPLGTSW